MANGIQGLDRLMKKYNALAQGVAGQGMERAVGAAVQMVKAEARLLCPVGDGELRRSISSKVETEGDKVIGAAYTNKAHGPFVEFGTGPKGEANHSGISPLVSPSYSQEPWWIHESQIDAETAEQYGWFYIDTKDGRFYRCSGQAAQPFLYPALKNNEERATRDISDYVSKEIRKVCE